MASIELRKEVTAKARITYTKKRALHAQQCDACGKIFEMRGRTTRDHVSPGTLIGMFDRCVGDRGNGFSATICSFACADVLYTGKWRDMKEYRPYARAHAILERIEAHLTADVRTEAEITEAWEKQEDNTPKRQYADRVVVSWG